MLKPGETKEVVAYYNTGNSIAKTTISVLSGISNGEEYYTDDNSKTLTLGFSDIEVGDVEIFDTLPISTIKTVVANNGSNNAENATAYLRQGSFTGYVIASKSIGTINAQTETEIEFEINPFDFEYDSDIKQLYLTVTTESEEVTESNNYNYVLMQNPNKEHDFDVVISNAEYDVADKELNINAIVCNNVPTSSKPAVIMEIYKSDNTLAGSNIKEVNFLENQTIAVDASVPMEFMQEDNYTIKVSVFDSLDSLNLLAQSDTSFVVDLNAGDVSGDGLIDISDVIMAAEIAVGNANYNSEQIIRANVSSKEDMTVDISDVILIAERAVGGTDLFPVEQ